MEAQSPSDDVDKQAAFYSRGCGKIAIQVPPLQSRTSCPVLCSPQKMPQPSLQRTNERRHHLRRKEWKLEEFKGAGGTAIRRMT